MLIKYFTLYFTGLGALNQFTKSQNQHEMCCVFYSPHRMGSYPHMLADTTPTPMHKLSIGDVTKFPIEENGKLITI